MPDLELIGRSSSHFTRVPVMFAHEICCKFRFTPILDLASLDVSVYGGNPALRFPVLLIDGTPLYGALNICRELARIRGVTDDVFWPEDYDRNRLLQNAHELLMTAMSTQVTLVISKFFAKLPTDNALPRKLRPSLNGILGWLADNLDAVKAELPGDKMNLFEPTLYCLLEHINFRRTLSLESYHRLLVFVEEYGTRESALATPYRFDE